MSPTSTDPTNPNPNPELSSSSTLPILWRDSTPPPTYHGATWTRVFNGLTDSRLPRAVVHATSAQHVVQAVRLAREHGCRVSVRSGGHSWAGWSVREGAVLVDLGGLRGVELAEGEEDGGDRVVRVGPGITGRELNEALEGRGRFFPGGHCPDVGVGGFLLQGGMGWNAKNWGWACEAVVGIDVVTAEGEEIFCDKEQNSDLFWAARGSGPGFPAIVTRFHLLTRETTGLYQSLYFYPISKYEEVLQWTIDLCPTADKDTEIVCVGMYPPTEDKIFILANFLTFKNTLPEAQAALQPMQDTRPDGVSMEVFCKETTLREQYEMQTAANPVHWRYLSENAYIANNASSVPRVLGTAFTTLPTRRSAALYFSMNPTSRRALGGEEMALSVQSDHYFAVYVVWEDEGEDEKCREWVRGVMRGVEGESVGSYLGDADMRVRRARFWGEEEGRRVMRVRREWDPKGRICGFLGGDERGDLGNVLEWS